MKILLLADTEDPALWDYYRKEHLAGCEMILAAGDLKAEYLTFLVTMSNLPVFYVHGNHNAAYDHYPPEGCECIDDRLVTVNGLRILGLGGSAVYSGGKYQYTERQMKRRIARLKGKVRRMGGVDIVLTHCPPKGFGDADDYAHRGFEAFLPMLDKWKPKALVHGHVHMTYGRTPRELRCGDTRIINAYQKYMLEMEPESAE